MKILIVNNGLHEQKVLEQAFSQEGKNELTVISWDGFVPIMSERFDLAVLSGSSNFSVVGNEDSFIQELEFIRTTSIPILGICYGCELITVAFGGTLKMLPKKEQGVLHIKISATDPIFQDIEDLFVYEGHHWAIDSLPSVLLPLAASPHGVEAVRHSERLIYGLQFHPEKLEHETAGQKIVENFISLLPK